MRGLRAPAAMALWWLALPAGAGAAGLVFDFHPSAGMDPLAIAGFQAAGARFSSIFQNNVTVSIRVDYRALGVGILGSAGSSKEYFYYSDVRDALTASARSAADQTAVLNLPAGDALPLYLNRTLENGGSATPYLDNNGSVNNRVVQLNTANAKALGAVTTATYDADITFSSGIAWDFNRADGIAAGSYDFVGVAMHEIGHALGFVSGVDVLDVCNAAGNPAGCTYGGSPPPFPEDAYPMVTPLDFYRYSTASYLAGGYLDWTADTRSKYFSLDGGATILAGFSTGRYLGDGAQASHWKAAGGLTLLEPYAYSGRVLELQSLDLLALDAVGWNTPEPGTALVALAGLAFLVWRRRGATS